MPQAAGATRGRLPSDCAHAVPAPPWTSYDAEQVWHFLHSAPETTARAHGGVCRILTRHHGVKHCSPSWLRGVVVRLLYTTRIRGALGRGHELLLRHLGGYPGAV